MKWLLIPLVLLSASCSRHFPSYSIECSDGFKVTNQNYFRWDKGAIVYGKVVDPKAPTLHWTSNYYIPKPNTQCSITRK